MIAGLTVLVVDRDPRARAQLIEALRRIGLHAFGAFAPIDAVALLEGIDAELVVVRAGDPDVAVRVLGARTMVVEVDARAGVAESLATIRAALGEPASEHPAN
ncbi:MAG TPA: hypothetical protein VFF06_06250 [Polyangia bacterium]|nr:hypothetical protein [Polyangia bacterium]